MARGSYQRCEQLRARLRSRARRHLDAHELREALRLDVHAGRHAPDADRRRIDQPEQHVLGAEPPIATARGVLRRQLGGV